MPLISESLDIKFGQSDVYDNSAARLNRNRDPGSRARDKNNDGKGKGWGGKMEVNRAEGIDNHGESDNRHSHVEFGN